MTGTGKGELDAARRRQALLDALLVEAQVGGGAPSRIERHQGSVLPLSPAQERLWFLQELEPGSPAYNVPEAWRFKGPLEADVLRRSLAEIVRRHDVLRTTFHAVDGKPHQRIAPDVAVDVPLTDLTGQPQAEREERAQAIASADAARPFELALGPLFRFTLVRLAPDEHVLLFNRHHAVSDAWSGDVFFRELAALYEAFVRGAPSPLPPLPIQHGDYVHWRKSWTGTKEFEDQVSFWRRTLAGSLPALELPADRPRPGHSSFRGATVSARVPSDVAARLRALGQEQGTTPFMTLLAAFDALLCLSTGQTDVLVGTPISMRDRLETEGLIGLFLNTIVVRTDLSGEPSFRELLRRVKEASLAAFDHHDLPFEKLVEEINPERVHGANPVFQVMFVLTPDPGTASRIADLAVTRFFVSSGTSKFDFTLFATEREAGLDLMAEYSTELFDADTAQALLARFVRLLPLLTSHPDKPILEHEALTDEDLALLARWNDTSAPLRPEPCVHALVEAQRARAGDAPAVRLDGVEMSYEELGRRSDLLARRLCELGVGRDGRVAVAAGRSFEAVVAVLSVLKAGGAYVPIDPSYPPERIRFMLEDSKVQAVLVRRDTQPALAASTCPVLVLDELDWETSSSAGGKTTAAPPAVKPDDLCYVIYTSGSTGQPKAVAMPHAPLLNLLDWQLSASAGLPPGARTLQWASLSFDVSFQEIFSTWAAGGCLVLVPEEVRRDPVLTWRLVAEQRVERLFVPFVALQQLADAAAGLDTLPTTLREVTTAGEKLHVTPAIVKLFERLPGCALHDHYGPSETHVVTSNTLEGPPARWEALPPIGRPIPNVVIHVVNEAGARCPPGSVGEICIGGAAVARGYLGRPELTAKSFVADPWTGGRMYRSGDLGRHRRDGRLECLGRRDDQVKVRGHRVELGEVESALATHPQVREAAVALRPGPGGHVELVGCVVARRGAAPTGAELRAHAATLLPSHAVPADVLVMEKLPLTGSGKVDRRALAASPAVAELRTHDARAGAEPPPPHDLLELRLARIWEAVFGRPVGAHEDFFEIGGHSLLAVQLISQAEKALGRRLPLALLFQAPTIAELAPALKREGLADSWSTVVPINPDGDRSPLFFLPTLGGGGGGGLLRYRNLALRLGPDQPSIGLEAPRDPFPSFASLAIHYAGIIRIVQPQGPYFLAGYCFGGNLALEVASQLRAQGQHVSLVALLDSSPPHLHGKRRRIGLRDLPALLAYFARRVQALPRMPASYWRMAFNRRIRPLVRRLQRKPQDRPVIELRDILDMSQYPADYRQMAETHWRALMTHVPKPYPGAVVLLRVPRSSAEGTFLLEEDYGWGQLALGGVTTEEVRGTHESFLEAPTVEELAARVRHHLHEARRAAGLPV